MERCKTIIANVNNKLSAVELILDNMITTYSIPLEEAEVLKVNLQDTKEMVTSLRDRCDK